MTGPAGSNTFAGAPAITLETGDTVTCAATTMTAMTKETGEPIQRGSSTQTAWWKFTPGAGGDYRFDTLLSPTGSDTVLAIYTGTAVNALSLVGYNDDEDGPSSMSVLVVTLNAGTTYRIQAHPWSNGDANSIVLRATLIPAIVPTGPSGSDSFSGASALVLEDDDTVVSASTDLSTMTKETGEPIQSGGAPTQTAWWKFTAPERATYSFDTVLSPSSADTTLAVYKGTAVNALTLLGYNDDDHDDTAARSRVNVMLSSGSTCYIQVTPYSNGDAGPVTLRAALVSALPDPTPPTSGQGSDYFQYATAMEYPSVSVPTPSAALTLEPDEPDPLASQGIHVARTAWWTFTAPETERVGLDLFQSVMPDGLTYVSGIINVYTGSSIDALTLVATGTGNGRMIDPVTHMSPYGYLVEMDFAATEGTTYYIQVGWVTGNIDYVLNIAKWEVHYSPWVNTDDYLVTSSEWIFADNDGRYEETHTVEGLDPAQTRPAILALLHDMLADTVNQQLNNPVVDKSGFFTYGNITGLFQDGIGSGMVKVRFHVNHFGPYGDPVFAEAHTAHAAPYDSTALRVDYEDGDPAPTAVTGEITKLAGLVEAGSSSKAHPVAVDGTFSVRLLLSKDPYTDYGTDFPDWDLDDSRLLTDVPVHVYKAGTVWNGNGNFDIPVGPLDITDGMDKRGTFWLVQARPATMLPQYDLVNEGLVDVEYAAWIGEITYLFHAPAYRYVYPGPAPAEPISVLMQGETLTRNGATTSMFARPMLMSAAVDLTEDFEGGSNGTVITTANSIFEHVGGLDPVFTSEQAHSGSLSAKTSLALSTLDVPSSAPGGEAPASGDFWFRVAGTTSDEVGIFTLFAAPDEMVVEFVVNATGFHVRRYASSGMVEEDVTLPASTWLSAAWEFAPGGTVGFTITTTLGATMYSLADEPVGGTAFGWTRYYLNDAGGFTNYLDDVALTYATGGAGGVDLLMQGPVLTQAEGGG